MIEQDTIKLLRECDAGVKMGIASIDDVLSRVKRFDGDRRVPLVGQTNAHHCHHGCQFGYQST